MSNVKKLMMSAASGGGPSVNVEEVFSTDVYSGNSSTQTIINDIDLSGEGGLVWIKNKDAGGQEHTLYDTERGAGNYLISHSNGTETYNSTTLTSFNSNGFSLGSKNFVNASGYDFVSWTFRKAPGFFDAVAYTGGSLTSGVLSHSLEVKPEMVIIKQRNAFNGINREWAVGAPDVLGINNNTLSLNNNYANGTLNYNMFNTTSGQTDTQIKLHGNENGISSTAGTYIAYLFASAQGVSKVGGFSHTQASNTTVDCGFSNGPQFVLVKPTSVTGNWLLFDDERGLTSSVAPALFPNLNNAEYDQNQIDPTSSGFIMKSGYWTTGNYMFYAIAAP